MTHTFAKALHGLMIETNVGTRWTWHVILGIEEREIQDWFDGKKLPSEIMIGHILIELEKTIAKFSFQYTNFRNLEPIEFILISELAPNHGQTLGQYVLSGRQKYMFKPRLS